MIVKPATQGNQLARGETSTPGSRFDDSLVGPGDGNELGLTIRSFYDEMKFIFLLDCSSH